MPFTLDATREQAWRARFVVRARAIAADPRLDVRAAAALEVVVPAPYPTAPEDLAVRWLEKSGKAPANGELRWRSLEPDADDRVSTSFFAPDSPEAAMAESLFHFEDHPDGGDGVMVVSRADGALFVLDSGDGSLLPLAIPFETYVSLQIEVLGLAGILDAFAEARAHGMPKDSASARRAASLARSQRKNARRALETARRLFPDATLDALEQRCAALGPKP